MKLNNFFRSKWRVFVLSNKPTFRASYRSHGHGSLHFKAEAALTMGPERARLFVKTNVRDVRSEKIVSLSTCIIRENVKTR